MTEVLTPKALGGLTVGTPEHTAEFVNMLIYGDPGVGKTVLAASAAEVAEMGPVLIIDVEGGTLSLRKLHPNVDVVRVRNFEEFTKLYAALRNKEGGYKTVVLDSITEIQKFGMYGIMKRVIEDDPDRDPDLPGIGEWGKNIEQTRKLVRAFRDLPCNTILTALAMTEKDRRGNSRAKPSLSGKLSGEVAGFLDIVVYMYKKDVDGEIKRLLLTTGTDDIIAKDRTDNLPPVLEDPTMKKIHTLMNQPELKEDTK